MFEQLSTLGYGLVTFAIIIGVGVVILSKMGTSVADCATGYAYNVTDGYCTNTTGTDTQNAAAGSQNLYYLEGQMGSSGLAGWTPAIIALAVGMLFLGVFMVKSGRKV